MSKVRRGNVFVAWKGDHSPRDVHVYENGRLVVKWNLKDWVSMKGKAPAQVLRLIVELEEEGAL